MCCSILLKSAKLWLTMKTRSFAIGRPFRVLLSPTAVTTRSIKDAQVSVIINIVITPEPHVIKMWNNRLVVYAYQVLLCLGESASNPRIAQWAATGPPGPTGPIVTVVYLSNLGSEFVSAQVTAQENVRNWNFSKGNLRKPMFPRIWLKTTPETLQGPY